MFFTLRPTPWQQYPAKHNHEKLTIFNHLTKQEFSYIHVHYVTRIAYIFGICVVQIWTGPSNSDAVGTVEVYEIYFHVVILILHVWNNQDFSPSAQLLPERSFSLGDLNNKPNPIISHGWVAIFSYLKCFRRTILSMQGPTFIFGMQTHEKKFSQ